MFSRSWSFLIAEQGEEMGSKGEFLWGRVHVQDISVPGMTAQVLYYAECLLSVCCPVRIIPVAHVWFWHLALWEPGRSSQWDTFGFSLSPLLRAGRVKQDSLRTCLQEVLSLIWMANAWRMKLLFADHQWWLTLTLADWSSVQHPSGHSTDCCTDQPVPGRDFIYRDVEFSMACRTR